MAHITEESTHNQTLEEFTKVVLYNFKKARENMSFFKKMRVESSREKRIKISKKK